MIANDAGDMIRYGTLLSNCLQCHELKEYTSLIQSFRLPTFIPNSPLAITAQEESNHDKNDCNKRHCGDNGNDNGGRRLRSGLYKNVRT